MLTRRRLLSLAVALGARAASATEPASLSVQEVAVPNTVGFGQRFLLLRPTRVPALQALPLLVLFHGLGETSSEALGIRAWHDRYGLPQTYARLTAPPIARTLPKERYLSDARLLTLNAELTQAPFPDLALVCPFTPNVLSQHRGAAYLDRYADYIEHTVLPAARAATATLDGTAHVGVDGVSLGGYVACEIFLRKSRIFGALGSMQGAFDVPRAERYARRLADIVAEQGRRDIHLTTTSFDPFRDPTLCLARRLGELGIAATLTDCIGPHDQRFLREAGTLEMLLFQARALHR